LLIMMRKAILPTILAALIILGLTQPVSAPINDPDMVAEPAEINVYVCSNFDVEIWIRNLPEQSIMYRFRFALEWSPGLIEFVGISENYAQERGWNFMIPDQGDYYCVFEAWVDEGGWEQGDAPWLKLTFHCSGAGTSPLHIDKPLIYLRPTTEIAPDTFSATVHQSSRPVGGILTAANKLAILSPYLTLLGLVGAVTVAVAALRRRKP